MTFQVLDVSTWDEWGVEPRGATRHPWLSDPAGGLHLWKPAEGVRLRRREHWAEKIVSELASLVGVPAARVQLAERKGTGGCLSENLVAQGDELHAGARLLAGIDASFRPTAKGHAAYTIDNVVTVLDGVEPPAWPTAVALPPATTAFELFAGYLTLDALVLNRDRHAENWAILRSRRGNQPDRLSPLFDNASGLGLSLSEGNMTKKHDSRGLPSYVRRECLARPFARTGGEAPTLFEVAAQALWRCGTQARDHWLGRVDALSMEDLDAILAAVPGMSEVEARFVAKLVETTRRCIVDEFSQ